jgi:magnesium transporter
MRSCLARSATGELRIRRGAQIGDLQRLVDDPGELVWLDIVEPVDKDFAFLERHLGVHPLAMEDLLKRRQRTKLDTYSDQYVLVSYEVLPTAPETTAEATGQRLAEVHMFTGRSHLVTVHWHRSPALEATMERLSRSGSQLGAGVGALLYEVLDTIVDGYFPVIDRLSEQVDSLQDRVLEQSDPHALRELLACKRQLLDLRRAVGPLRDVANALLRREIPLIEPAAMPYLQDLYDHLIRVLDAIDLYRDMLAATLDAQMSVTANQLNAVMKRLTAFTVVLMVPTLIAGIYGMNFVNIPGFGSPIGYLVVLGVMAALVVAIAAYFRARNWF